jgi:hypothetical protein
MRPNTKFLTVVWGKPYISRFAELALPSFLAKGNLPALAEATNLEVVIMTKLEDIDFFERHATFLCLRKICPVRFVTIDDLITTGVYGVTLTLAYARPIIACGQEMLNTHFVFMNADFVLADGSLLSLCKHIRDGRAIVLGPSFRATAEAVEPMLKAALDKDTHILTMAPRAMVSLALPHPHPTTAAKIVNQDLCHVTHPNQFFWRIDKNTLLGRYYLIFMLCLKPERVISSINSYCDYALIPEMCPSGDEVAMKDSDEFFMLELQQRNQESEMLRFGRQSIDDIAKSLQYWTTAEHRRAAKHTIVFHTNGVPSGFDDTKNETQRFIDKLQKQLGKPRQHSRHPYWIRGVYAWQNLFKPKALPVNPPELASFTRQSNPVSLESLEHRLFLLIWFAPYKIKRAFRRLGFALLSKLDHHDRLLLEHAFSDALARETVDGLSLIVTNAPDRISLSFKTRANVKIMSLWEFLDNSHTLSALHQSTYKTSFIHMEKDCSQLGAVIECLQSKLGDEGRIYLVVHCGNGESKNMLSSDLINLLEPLNLGSLYIEQCLFVGGYFKHISRIFCNRLVRGYVRDGVLAFVWILPLLTIALPLGWIDSHKQKKVQAKRKVAFCSGIFIRLAPIGKSLRDSPLGSK